MAQKKKKRRCGGCINEEYCIHTSVLSYTGSLCEFNLYPCAQCFSAYCGSFWMIINGCFASVSMATYPALSRFPPHPHSHSVGAGQYEESLHRGKHSLIFSRFPGEDMAPCLGPFNNSDPQLLTHKEALIAADGL